jgi:hypothetical protein
MIGEMLPSTNTFLSEILFYFAQNVGFRYLSAQFHNLFQITFLKIILRVGT